MRCITALVYLIVVVLVQTASIPQTFSYLTSDVSTQKEAYPTLDETIAAQHAELRDADNAADPILAKPDSKPADKVSSLENAPSGEKQTSTNNPSDDPKPKLDVQDQHDTNANELERQKQASKQDPDQEVPKDGAETNGKQALDVAGREARNSPEPQPMRTGAGLDADDIVHNQPDHNADNEHKKEQDTGEILAPRPIQNPNDLLSLPNIGGTVEKQVAKQNVDHKAGEGDQAGAQVLANAVDDDDSSSPTVIWFVLFSVVIVLSVAIYLHRSGLRAPSALGFEPVRRHSEAEEVPLMTPVDQIVSEVLSNLRVPTSAVDKYVQAFHNNRISRVDQLDDPTWNKLALPSAIELELRRRFQDASVKPRSPGLTLHRDHGSRATPNAVDIEFDDWSFDDEEEINNEI